MISEFEIVGMIEIAVTSQKAKATERIKTNDSNEIIISDLTESVP